MKQTTLIQKQFTWTGINEHGNKVTGEINAVTTNYAKIKLAQQGITAVKLTKKRALLFSQYKKLPPHELTMFFRQFAILFKAGVPIIQCCDILQNNQMNLELKSIIGKLKNDMTAGKGLARSLHIFPRYFDRLTCHLIELGEQTGTFATMLARIANHKEKTLQLKNKINQALFYPTIITVIAIAITLMMLTLIVPRFAELFASMQKSLPAVTLSVICVSDWIRHYGYALGLLIFFIVITAVYVRKFLWIRHLFENSIIKIPFIKTILEKSILANIARNLATTFSSGMPVLESIKIIAPASGHHAYSKALLTLAAEISKGKQLHRAMQNNALFPKMFVQMTRIGEETGILADMLEKIAELYEADIDHFVIRLSHYLELLIMLFLGVLIGGLVIAIYMPIFKLGTVL